MMYGMEQLTDYPADNLSANCQQNAGVCTDSYTITICIDIYIYETADESASGGLIMRFPMPAKCRCKNGVVLCNITKFVKNSWERLTRYRKSGILYLALGEIEC